MKIKSRWTPGPGARVLGTEYDGNRWIISVAGPEVGACTGYNERSTRRHSRYIRSLLDLQVQGSVVTVKLHTSRWRCQNDECERQTFSEQLSDIARPYARQTERVAEIIRLFGHCVGGRPAERLMKRLGLPTSDDTILRHLKGSVANFLSRVGWGYDHRAWGRRNSPMIDFKGGHFECDVILWGIRWYVAYPMS